MKKLLSLAVLAGAVCALQAQPVQERRANMRGGGDSNSGKCTIEVRVDGSAEVEISGEIGRLRTLAGQPAMWTRMECTSPMPRDPGDFRFRGIDGRGRQELRRDPRSNRGVAVVYIEDSQGGSEGYTFDVEWGGGGGGYGPGAGRPGGYGQGAGVGPGRGGGSRIATERALEICRTEVRLRAEREYGLRGIEITNTALDNNPGRNDWITGTFSERGVGFRRGGGYRFACSVDFSNGAVRSVDITRVDGRPMRGGIGGPGQGSSRIATERALEVCRSEVRLRAEREYGLRGIEITNAALDNNPGRNDWIMGTFTERGAGLRAGGGYRFACSVDFSNGAVRSVDITRVDGRPMRGGQGSAQAIRFCQDAVVARMNRDGYQNVRFGGNQFNRNDYLVGTATGERGRQVDNFEYNCTIDNGGRVRSVEVQRR